MNLEARIIQTTCEFLLNTTLNTTMKATRISIDCLFLAFGLNILCFTSDAQSKDTERPEVTILQGTLRGKILKTHHGRNISAFLGIPYAEPPTGNLRFVNQMVIAKYIFVTETVAKV